MSLHLCVSRTSIFFESAPIDPYDLKKALFDNCLLRLRSFQDGIHILHNYRKYKIYDGHLR
jgi:hypothetical protein